MKDLLYVGNKLSNHGSTATAIEVLGPFLERDGFRVCYASTRKNKMIRFADMLWQTIARSRKIDYVLIDTYSTWNFWYAFAVSQLCRLLRLKYIPILHGGNLAKRLARNPVLCRMIFSHSVVNVAPSGYLGDAFEKAGFSVSRIPNPFDSSHFQFKNRDRLEPKMLWVRSLAAIYNPEMAVRTLEIVAQKYPAAILCMVGPDKDGLQKRLVEMASASKLNVIFTGRLSKSQWAEMAKSYDIFINTSHVDNAPFSVIEAASLGMAVVSTNVGGIPHLLTDGENALLVNDNDAQAMADAVISLIENPGLATRIASQSRSLANQSQWENVGKKWREILI